MDGLLAARETYELARLAGISQQGRSTTAHQGEDAQQVSAPSTTRL